jgi:hypothetical protein
MISIIGNWIDAARKEKVQISRKDGDLYWMEYLSNTSSRIYFNWLRDIERFKGAYGGHVPCIFNEDGTISKLFPEGQMDLILVKEEYFLFCTKNGQPIKRFNFHSSDSPQNNFEFSRQITHNES